MLVAEDELIIRMDLREMLEEGGHQVVGEAGDGETAIELARSLRPDIAILDIKMPVKSGLDVARVLTDEAICPVVIVTAFSQKELIEEAAKLGAFAYVVKPFDKSDLLPAIEIAAVRYEQMSTLAGQVSDLEERLETRKIVERAKGMLMQTRGISEPEAFRMLQKESMDRRLPLREVAAQILDAAGQV